MTRRQRVVVPGCPLHITHRGNRKERIFQADTDFIVYLELLREYSEKFGMSVFSYCLMGNHVHLVAAGRAPESIARAIGCTHMRFAQLVNLKHGWTGHAWANRYFSTMLDEPHLWAAARYVENNPVRAGLVSRATDYRWSSARHHAFGTPDSVLAPDSPFPGPISDWAAWLAAGVGTPEIEVIRNNTLTGLPTGSPEFVDRVAATLNRSFTPPRRGRPPKGLEKVKPGPGLFDVSDGRA